MSTLCLIPARAGSKGLPGKNTKILKGKPLVNWTIETAITSSIFEEIAVTTDDNQVKEIARSLGVKVLDRPPELAQDYSLASQYLDFHSETIMNFENMMLLQVTSPLRNVFDVKESYQLLKRIEAGSTVVSFVQTTLRPSSLFSINQMGFAEQLKKTRESNRQQEEIIYMTNGAIFASNCQVLNNLNFDFLRGEVVPYIMPVERSVDIDTLEDFRKAEEFLV